MKLTDVIDANDMGEIISYVAAQATSKELPPDILEAVTRLQSAVTLLAPSESVLGAVIMTALVAVDIAIQRKTAKGKVS